MHRSRNKAHRCQRGVWPALLAPAVLAIGLTGCGEPPAPPQAAAASAPRVTLAPFTELRFYPEREAPASVLGKNESRLAAEVSARITALPVDSGDAFAAGQVLVRLDARDAELALARAEAALAQAEARLAQAEAQVVRAQRLREKNFISAEAASLRETERAAVAADRAAALANVASARRGVEKCTLRAPFKGVVRQRSAQLGEITIPGAPLLTLADTGQIQLVAMVQAADAEGLAQAAQADFVTAAGRHAVRPLRLSAAIQRESRTVETRFEFVAAPPPLGSEGRLVWREPRAHLAADLIVRRQGRFGVFIAEGDKARFHELSAAQEGRPAAVELPAAAQVVTHGRNALQDGMPLQLGAGVAPASGAAKQ